MSNVKIIAESTTQTLRTQIYDITGFEWQIIFWLRCITSYYNGNKRYSITTVIKNKKGHFFILPLRNTNIKLEMKGCVNSSYKILYSF